MEADFPETPNFSYLTDFGIFVDKNHLFWKSVIKKGKKGGAGTGNIRFFLI